MSSRHACPLRSRAKILSYCAWKPQSIIWLPGDGMTLDLGRAAPSPMWSRSRHQRARFLLRGLERTCVMWVKGRPVAGEPSPSVPAPHLSLLPLSSPRVFLSLRYLPLCLLESFSLRADRRTKTHPESNISLKSNHTPSICNLSSLFHPFPLFYSSPSSVN